MNFIQDFFANNRDDLMDQLELAGLTTEQASQFLPVVASSILKAFQHKEIEEIIATMGIDEPTKLLGVVKVSSIAQKAGMNPYQVTSGFEVIMPVMARAFLNHEGGIIKAAASIAWGLPGDLHALHTKPVGN
jgi:hypothetical protein